MSPDIPDALPNKRVQRTRRWRASSVSCVGSSLKDSVSRLLIAKGSMRKSQTLMLVLLVFTASIQVGAQGRSPLLDKVVKSVKKHRPLWYFIPGVCTCPALVSNQLSYAMGGWHLCGVASKRHVRVYVSTIPSV